LTPILDGVRKVELDAVELDIAAVTRDGAQLPYTYDGRRLAIDFGGELAAGSGPRVTVAYAATSAARALLHRPDDGYPRRPRQVWSQGQDEDSRHWFPCFDAPTRSRPAR
jgi:aminopeptidase N